jgi:hypothetical protein
VVLLGPGPGTARLATFSFLLRPPGAGGRFLHHNFVAAVLNDLFGIQARGGCACAGPYAQEVLGIDSALAAAYEEALLDRRGLEALLPRERDRVNSGRELLRPGFTRISLPYFASDEEVDYVLAAVRLTAEAGWALLPQYSFDGETAEWAHRRHAAVQAWTRRWLGAIDWDPARLADGNLAPDPARLADGNLAPDPARLADGNLAPGPARLADGNLAPDRLAPSTTAAGVDEPGGEIHRVDPQLAS